MNSLIMSKPVKRQSCIIDYLSFTWVPELIVPYRKLARHNNQTFKQFVAEYDGEGQPLNLGLMEENMVDALKTFFMRASEIFNDCALAREEFEESFTLRLRLGGIFGYSRCWDIQVANTIVGIAATGGTAGTCYVSFTGKGCALLDKVKLQSMLRVLPEVKITRVDIALDDYKGVTGYNHAFDAYTDRQFITRGLPPKCNIHASGGVMDLESGEVNFFGGRTFEVGKRESGKLYRGYEKGRQQGQPDSVWFRHEVELRSVNREIPLHVLTQPDRYFAGFYPYTAHVLDIITGNTESSVIPCKKTKLYKLQAKIVMQSCIDSARRTAGGLVNVMREIGMNDSEIIQHLLRDAIPVKLRRVAIPPFKQEIQPC